MATPSASYGNGTSRGMRFPPYAVIVSDMRMPGMDGVQFLAKVKIQSPHSVRIMLKGVGDIEAAIKAVNEGNIFRFLSKPCDKELMSKTLTAALVQYRLITAEKELLERTLHGSIQALTEVLSLVNPTAFGRAMRRGATFTIWSKCYAWKMAGNTKSQP